MAERGQVQPAGGGEGDRPAVDAADSDEYGTPQDLFAELNRRYQFVHDCCASPLNAKVNSFWTKEDDAAKHLRKIIANGIASRFWHWNNPPYSKPNLPLFVELHREAAPIMPTVMLVPATPGAAWFQDFVLGGADLLNYFSVDRGPLEGKVLQFSAPLCRIEVNFLRGRLDFVHPTNPHQTSAKTDSALVRFFPRGVNW